MVRTLKIATRKSPLALWQANHVKAKLEKVHPELEVALLPMTTEGDIKLKDALSEIGGKGLFLKELEHAMLAGKADIAVHSMKDVPYALPNGLTISTQLTRETPYDVLVSNHFKSLDALPEGATVGTASMRRQSQLLQKRPDLKLGLIRGNVGTRLKKLDEGEFDAIILAEAGLVRLELEERIAERFSKELMLPAVGQGAIGIETREDDRSIHDLLKPLNDETTANCVLAERTMNELLQGSCRSAIAAYCEEIKEGFSLHAFVGSSDGTKVITAKEVGTSPVELGKKVGHMLLDKGAEALLNE